MHLNGDEVVMGSNLVGNEIGTLFF